VEITSSSRQVLGRVVGLLYQTNPIQLSDIPMLFEVLVSQGGIEEGAGCLDMSLDSKAIGLLELCPCILIRNSQRTRSLDLFLSESHGVSCPFSIFCRRASRIGRDSQVTL
jgi:hypothetical protein